MPLHPVFEKKHRLPLECYRGTVSGAFTLCFENRKGPDLTQKLVQFFTGTLKVASENYGCVVPVFVLMPDHQHILLTGESLNSDLWKTIVLYKQKTGFSFSRQKIRTRWQKDFYDRLIRDQNEVLNQAKYLLENPVRNNLVCHWREYPWIGSVGCRFEDMVQSIMWGKIAG